MDLDYRALVEARETLRQAAEARYYAAHGSQNEMAMREGMVVQALRQASDAIFGALNVLGIYVHDGEADRVLHLREWEDASMTHDEQTEEAMRRR